MRYVSAVSRVSFESGVVSQFTYIRLVWYNHLICNYCL
jgi:hypothetical protein